MAKTVHINHPAFLRMATRIMRLHRGNRFTEDDLMYRLVNLLHVDSEPENRLWQDILRAYRYACACLPESEDVT